MKCSTPPTPHAILARIPQQVPFRFVDEIHEIDCERVAASYTWDPDHAFYEGHFPGDPVTPGVLLVECLAQCGAVPLALANFDAEREEGEKLRLLFTDAQVEFRGVVRPGERVEVEAERLVWRRRRLRVRARMTDASGRVVCEGELGGMGVPG